MDTVGHLTAALDVIVAVAESSEVATCGALVALINAVAWNADAVLPSVAVHMSAVEQSVAKGV